MIVGALQAQTSNWYRYQFKLHGGLKIGNTVVGTGVSKTGSLLLETDSITTDDVAAPTVYKIYSQGVQVNPDITSDGYVDGFTVYARKFLTDTVNITAATYTMSATNASQTLRCYNATYTEITYPANTMGVGAIVTIEMMPGAGPIRVNPGANAFRFSVLDSCTANTVNQTYQIEFWTTNKARFIGDWRD